MRKAIRSRPLIAWLIFCILVLCFTLFNHYRTCPIMFRLHSTSSDNTFDMHRTTNSTINCRLNSSGSEPHFGRVHSNTLQRRLPQCIIIGARKAGTRALLEYLAIHRQVRKADSEVHFFDNEDRFRLGIDFYRQSMPYSRVDQITVEKTPAYFVTPDVPTRIHAMNSSIRLVLIVREPVERLISDFAQLRMNRLQKMRTLQLNSLSGPESALNAMNAGGMETLPSIDWPNLDYFKLPSDHDNQSQLNDFDHSKSTNKSRRSIATTLLPTFEQLVFLSSGEVNVNYKPVRTSIYSYHLYRWLKLFHRDQLLVIDGDRLIRDPYVEMIRLERFLGLPPQIRRENFVFNQKKHFFCVRQLPADGQTPVNGSHLWSIRCLNSSKGRKHPTVSINTIKRLRQFYAPYNRHFFKIIGQTFNWFA